MKITIEKTEKTFEVTKTENGIEYVSNTYYLDLLSNGNYLISRDDTPIGSGSKIVSEDRFEKLAVKLNAKITIL